MGEPIYKMTVWQKKIPQLRIAYEDVGEAVLNRA
jgi:hypothetical protein